MKEKAISLAMVLAILLVPISVFAQPAQAADTTPPALTAGTASRLNSLFVAVSFTSDEAGTYYWEFDGVAPAPEALVKSVMSPRGDLAAGTNTRNFAGVSTEAHTLYIAAKDTAGNISPLLTIHIPPYPDGTAGGGDTTSAGRRLPFDDVDEDAWYYDAVCYVYEHGLMRGTSENKFSPDDSLTRAMIVTILYRNANSPDVSGLDNPFDDVADGQWYTDAVKWAAENGVVLGYGDGRFGTNDPVTKEQLAVLLLRTQQASGKIPPDILMDRQWPDWDKISDWAKGAVNMLTIQGIFADIPGTDFHPQQPAARAEVASMLYRYLTASGSPA